MTPAQNDTALFAAYAKTAPLEDLRVYVRLGEQLATNYGLPERAVQVLARMAALERALVDVDGTPSMRSRVLALISVFKESIPDWAGTPYKHGLALTHLLRKARAHGVSEDGLRRLRLWFCRHLGPLDAMGRLQPLSVPLPVEAVRDLIHFATPADQAAPVKPKAVNWRQRAIAAETRVLQLEAQLAAQASAQPPKARAPRQAVVRRPPNQVIITDDGKKQCGTCETWQDLAQFTWGDGGRTVRGMCRTCRKTQQQARRSKAA